MFSRIKGEFQQLCKPYRMSFCCLCWMILVLEILFLIQQTSLCPNRNRDCMQNTAEPFHPGTVQENLSTMWCADSYSLSYVGKDEVWFIVSCSAWWLLSFFRQQSLLFKTKKNWKHMARWKKIKMTCCASSSAVEHLFANASLIYLFNQFRVWLRWGEWSNPRLKTGGIKSSSPFLLLK